MSAAECSIESDNLRRSKRKKFRLDVVAAAHGNNQKKSKKDASGEADETDDDEFGELSVLTDVTDETADGKEDVSEDYDVEETTLSRRRTRRSAAHWGDYQDPFVDWVDQSGSFACNKCPSRYESRSSLSNHTKMHSAEKRKFPCELCDFSASTLKSLMHHNNVHKRYGVVSAQTSPAIVVKPEVVVAKDNNNTAPELIVAAEEPFFLDGDVHAATPPPVLERESDASSDGRTKTPTPTKIPNKLRADSKPSGSLSNSATPSTSSSVTPPLKTSPAPRPKRRQCPHCPFAAVSLSRLARHMPGHRLKEGFVCPAEGCNFMCRTAAFLQRHYTVHPETLPWPPRFVKAETKKTKDVVPRRMLIGNAQIRTHLKVSTDTGILKKCNIDNCTFQTFSQTQLIVHKKRAHQAKTSCPSHPFICFTCGHRAATYGALKVHKLTAHVSSQRRFHRTYYLKELVGDKFFIKYYTSRSELGGSQDGEESGDDSFDSIPGTSMNSEALAEIEKKATFCCNLCPYQAPTMNRCQRHHAKHFTPSPFKCRHCSWSSRSKEALVNHEKLHEDVKSDVVAGPSTDRVQSPQPPSESLEMLQTPLGEALKKWCRKEKSARPDTEDHFSRIIIDGQKGFKCVDCPYTSKYRGDMRSHKKRHDIEQMFRCVQCTYTTNRPVSLKDHMKQHVSVNSTLGTTKKVVVNQGVHIGSRKGTGRDRIYCCNRCPYVTLTLGCLWRHHRNHRTTAKFYICSNCSYSSTDARKMEEHTVIHAALGASDEAVPFVKRVDQEGRPVSSLTDLNPDKMTERKGKRKLIEEKKGSERKRKRSNEPTPTSESPIPQQTVVQPTRLLAERATRAKINYSQMAKNGGGKPTPSTSSASLEALSGRHELEMNESVEVSHWRIRDFLKTEFSIKASHQCPDCPFQNSDSDVFEKHLYFHLQSPTARPYTCSDCSYNTFTPTALLQHLKLHSDGVFYDPSMKRTTKHRKADHIPAGTRGFHCRTCTYKTANQRHFAEHSAYHRHQLVNRINVQMKRQPPKEEYQRPKMKHQFVARNAKYCKKCTFKCVSQSSFIEHVDRHGWAQLYKCHLCDYSDNNKSVVDFHQLNHHVMRDQTLHSINGAIQFRLENGVIQKPESELATPSAEDFAARARTFLKCSNCDYHCHVASELAFHMSVKHDKEPGARERASYLHMGLVPPGATVHSTP